MKTCIRCNEPKDQGEFYAHPGMADGRLNKCKVCCREVNIGNRNQNLEYYRNYDKSRMNQPQRVEARNAWAESLEGRVSQGEAKRAWSQRNSIKRSAQNAVSNAVRAGVIVKEPCVVCGTSKSQGHHEDYNKPLDVIWLCPKHHAERHKQMREDIAA